MGLLNRLSIARSIPDEKTIHGILITKVPMSKYITAMSELEDLPKALIEACFPDMAGAEIINHLQKIQTDDLTQILLNFLTRSPEIFISTIAILGDFERDALLALTPSELIDVIEAWWGLNDLTNFFKRIWEKAAQLLTRIPIDGYSAG